MRTLIIVIFLSILASLLASLFHIIKGKPNTTASVQTLTVRISLSIFLFLFLLLAVYMGWIKPHGVGE